MSKKSNEEATPLCMDKWNIYQRLSAAIKEIPTVVKTQSGGMRYKTVSHDDVLEAVKEPLLKYEIIAFPTKIEFSQDGNRSQCEMDIRFQNIKDKDDYIIIPSVGQGIGNDDKGPGKAISYAFKYGLLKTLAIKTGDDADNEDTEGKHISKEADQAKKRIEMQIKSLETEEDLKEFRNNIKTKEDLKLVDNSNPKIGQELREQVKEIDISS
jgi:hypothetical protein